MQLLVAFLIGWVQRGQAEIIEYLREEIRVLKGHLSYFYGHSGLAGASSPFRTTKE